MTRRRNKQGGGRREHAAPQHRPCNGNLPADSPEEDDREMGKAAQVMPSSNQFVQTCCLLCHRERKDWVGSLPHNGLMSPVGEIPASFMPSLAQNLLGEMPLWICQTCRKSVEEEERRVSLSHTTCKSQSCGGGSHSSSSSSSSTSCSSPSSLTCHGNSGDWDPSSFLSAHKLSGLWNSTNVNSIGGSTDGTSIHPTSRNLCKSSKQVKGCCQSQGSTGEGCHSSEHHRLCDLSAPPNGPTGVSSRQNPPLNPASSTTFSPTLSPRTKSSNSTSISPSRAPRGPHVVSSSPSLLNVNPPPPPPLSCSHSCNGNCSGGSGLPTGCTTGTTVNRDAACKGHKHTNITCDDEDEDSGSEQSSCTSSSTNQKEGKFCDCCYCEFFGQSTPPPAPTSRNYAEMREKLRIRLTKRKEEPNAKLLTPGEQTVDNRDVNELLDFINSNDAKTMTPSNSTSINSSKAAKRARYKLKKREKVLHEVNAQKAQDEYVAIEGMCASASDEALLQWPPLELEQVNSFLTSRLEEIKNTIKDSIRASFSVYDLNLDVNDFPKKAAMLEQKNLLSHSHLNGSSDLPEIDLDLSPLNLGYSKTNAKTPEDTEGATIQPVENGVVKRLSAVPTLSRMIWVQSAKVPVSELNSDLKAGIVPNEKNLTVSERQGSPDPPLAVPPTVLQSAVHPAVASRQRKPRKQYLQVQKRELFSVETVVGKLPSAGSMADDQKLRHLPEMDEVPSEHGSSILIASLPKSAEASGQDMCQRTGGGVETVTYKDICESPQPRKKGKLDDQDQCYITMTIDEIFLPKDVDDVDMDEVDREVECFKRFCLESAKQTRQKLVVDWTNFSLKKFLHGSTLKKQMLSPGMPFCERQV